MVERLEDGARRLELASTQGQAGVGASSPDMEERPASTGRLKRLKLQGNRWGFKPRGIERVGEGGMRCPCSLYFVHDRLAQCLQSYKACQKLPNTSLNLHQSTGVLVS